MNVVVQTLSGWFAQDDGLRLRLRAAARRARERLVLTVFNGLSPAPVSATRSVQDSLDRRGSAPGESPAPSLGFPTAAGWMPLPPAELRTSPRLAAAPPRVAEQRTPEQRTSDQDRRYTERRIRDDGSPYGVERRSGGETRVGERRAAEAPSRHARSGVRGPHRHDADYIPHLPDLLARFHGRTNR